MVEVMVVVWRWWYGGGDGGGVVGVSYSLSPYPSVWRCSSVWSAPVQSAVSRNPCEMIPVSPSPCAPAARYACSCWLTHSAGVESPEPSQHYLI